MLQGEGNQSLEDYLSTFNAKMEFEIVIRAESNNYKAMLSHVLRPPYLDSFADMTHITETETRISSIVLPLLVSGILHPLGPCT